MNDPIKYTEKKIKINERVALFETKKSDNQPKKEKENNIKQNKMFKGQKSENLSLKIEENKTINNNNGSNMINKTIQKSNNKDINNELLVKKYNSNEIESGNIFKAKKNIFEQSKKENENEKKENVEKNNNKFDKNNINNNNKEINIKDNNIKDNKKELNKIEEKTKNLKENNTYFYDKLKYFDQNNNKNNIKSKIQKDNANTNINNTNNKNIINEPKTVNVTINDNSKCLNNNNNNCKENNETKNLNKDNKTKNEISQKMNKNENSKKQQIKENYEKKPQIDENELKKQTKSNKESSGNNIVHKDANITNKYIKSENNKILESNNKEKNEKKTELITNNINNNNNINNIINYNKPLFQQKILNFENKNKPKRSNEKNEMINISIQKKKIEELLLKFDPNALQVQDNKKINKNNNNQKKFNNNNPDKNKNSDDVYKKCKSEALNKEKLEKLEKEKEKEKEKNEVITPKTNISISEKESDVQYKNKNSEDEMYVKKGVNHRIKELEEILKNKNNANLKVKDKRKKEIEKIAEKEKEEAIINSNGLDVESDNEKDGDNIDNDDLDIKPIVSADIYKPLKKDIREKQRKTTIFQKPIILQKAFMNNEKKENNINNYNENINNNNNKKQVETNIETCKIINKENEKNIDNNKQYENKSKINELDTIEEEKNNSFEDEIFLEKSTQEGNINSNDSFCECFFLSSFSKDKGQLMDNSEKLQAECNHPFCSVLPAMQPELIYKYPEKDIRGLEINNLAASISFPNGIKVCYEKKENDIKTVKNYRSSLTNQTGERFFAVFYHFFLKMENAEFVKSYNITPMKNKLSAYENGITTAFNDENTNEVYKKLKTYQELNNREYIYIPYCACLVSRYPFIKQMEKCLESIILTINNNEESIDNLKKLIAYIVKSIPVPRHQSKVLFPLPYYNQLIDISEPYFKDMTEMGDNPIILLHNLSIDQIYCLFKLLIFEQKILIVGKSNDLVAQIILNFASLLYPFEWLHTFIPIMSEKMLKFLQAFLPFFNGINYSLFSKAIPILAKAAKGVFIFNIDEHTITINSNYKNNTKKINTSSYIHKHFQNMPKHLENLFLRELRSINDNFQKQIIDKRIANLKMKNLFIHVFVDIVQDYKKYSYVLDDYPIFNSFLMVEERKKYKHFYKDFISTQMFQMFIQKSLFDNKETYFQQRLSFFLDKKNEFGPYIYYKTFEGFKNEYSSFFEIKKNYVIKPFFIKGFKEYEENNFISKKKSIKLMNISNFVFKEYDKKKVTPLISYGLLSENKRIINKSIELNNDDDPKMIDVYIFPEQNKDILYQTKKRRSIKSNKIGIISDNDNNKNNIKFSQLKPNDENILSEDDRDEIKDNIREIISRIYRSDSSKMEEDKKTIIGLMETRFGREYLISIFNMEKNDIKNVTEITYNFFLSVIFNLLLTIIKHENEILYNIYCAIRLIKACLCIKTIKNKKEVLLCDDLYCKLDNYPLISQTLFWEKWVEDEMTISDIEILKMKDEIDNFDYSKYVGDEKYELYKKHSYDILESLPSIMMKMKLKNYFIIQAMYDLTKIYIIEENQYTSLMHEVIDEIQLYKKLIK